MKVGDRVVCIDSTAPTCLGLIKGDMYTIACITNVDIGDVAIQVDELPHWRWFDNENHINYIGYSISRFRKIQPNFTNALTLKLATDFIEEDKKVIETEQERVLTKEF